MSKKVLSRIKSMETKLINPKIWDNLIIIIYMEVITSIQILGNQAEILCSLSHKIREGIFTLSSEFFLYSISIDNII